LRLIRPKKQVHKTVNRCLRRWDVHRSEHEMSRLRSQRGHGTVSVSAQLTDDDDVRILAERCFHAVWNDRVCGPDFALVIIAFFRAWRYSMGSVDGNHVMRRPGIG